MIVTGGDTSTVTPKVLHVITGLGTGGAEAMLANVVGRSRDGSCQVAVCSLTTQGIHGEMFIRMGIPFLCLDMGHGLSTIAGIRRLARWMRYLSPTVVMSWLYHADLMTTMAWKWAGSPGALTWNLRCSVIDYRSYGRSIRLLQGCLAKLSSMPSMVVGNSLAGIHCHRELGYHPKRWRLMPNGFDLDRYRPDLQARVEWRGRWGVEEDAVLAVMVARVDPMKDHWGLLTAFVRAAQRVSNFYLVLIGQGTERDGNLMRDVLPHLDPSIARRILTLGRRDDVHRILPACDLAVLSSTSEGFPNVIGEAMSCGLPCVATNVGDVSMIIGATGEIVPASNPEKLSDAMIRMAELPLAGRRRLGLKARASIDKRFGLPAIVDNYHTLFQEMTENVRHRRII